MSTQRLHVQGWKHIAALGILSATIAGIVITASFATRTVASTQLPISAGAGARYRGASACTECHPSEHEAWIGTKHARASSDEIFGEDWIAHGRPHTCLQCHSTGYDPQTGQTALEGVSCESCHGPFQPDHPPAIMPVTGKARDCGECHWTTYNEWQLSVHAREDVTCTSCHAVHSQAHTMPDGRLPCASCHEERYEAFAHATHASVGADCESCHMYTPPAREKTEGRVSTGHTFAIGPEACASCHRDTIHTRHEIPDLVQEISDLRTQLPTDGAQRLVHLENEVNQLRDTSVRNLYVGMAAGGIVGAGTGFALAWALIWTLERGRKQG